MPQGDMEGGIIDEMDGQIKVLRYFKMEWLRDHLDVVLFESPPASGKRGDVSLFGSRKGEIAALSIYKTEAGSLEFGGLAIRPASDMSGVGELVEKRSEIFIDSSEGEHMFQHHFIVDIERYAKCLAVRDRHGNCICIRVQNGRLDCTSRGNVVRYRKPR